MHMYCNLSSDVVSTSDKLLPTSCAAVIILIIFNPLTYPLNVGFHLLNCIRLQLDNDFRCIAFTGIFQYYLHDLTFHVLLDLFAVVSTSDKSVVQELIVGTQNNHEVEPPLRKHVTGVEIHNHATFSHRVFQFVTKLVVVQYMAFVSFIPALMKSFGLDKLTNIDVLEARRGGQQFSGGCFTASCSQFTPISGYPLWLLS